MSAPRDPFSEVVDERRRWRPEWYQWLKENTSGGSGSGLSGTGDVFVTNFPGVDKTGASDSTVGIQAAITSLTSGQDLIFPPGTYKISNTIFIGDGTSATNSTYQGVCLRGQGVPPQGAFGISTNSPVKIVWAGAVNGTMIQVSGPLSGWGIVNIMLDGLSVAGTGVVLQSAQNGDIDWLTVVGCKQFCMRFACYGTYPLDGQANTMHNTFRNITLIMPNFSTVFGIAFQGAGPPNPASCCFNLFNNTTIVLLGTNCFAMYLLAADTNHFIDTHFINYGGMPNAGLTFDYTLFDSWPGANVFDGIDNAGFGGTAWQNNGTP